LKTLKLSLTGLTPSKTAKRKESVCEEADRVVSLDRRNSYGHPLDNFTDIAKVFEIVLNVPVTPEQAALCMVGVKISREAHLHNRDNLVDIAGYAKVVDLIHEERKHRLANLPLGGTQE